MLTLTGLVIVPLLLVGALVIDVGYAKDQRRITQNAADAAALAAAQEMDGTSGQLTRAVATAKTWAAKNLPGLTATDWVGCTDPDALTARPDLTANNTCISFDSATAPTKVRVRIPTLDQARFFGQLGSHDALQVTASAVASRTPSTTTQVAGPCGLCIIGDRTLQIGNSQIAVTGGEIQADRLTANAQDSNYGITPVPLRWYSQNNSNWGRNVQPAPATFNSRYSKLSAPVPNPFEAIDVSYAGLPISDANINAPAQTIQPDTIYRQSVNVSGNVTLAPNRTYYFRGNLQVNGGARLVGSGVTLVFVCESRCNGGEGGKFNFGSGSTVQISAPTSGPYAGLAIMFDPTWRGGTPNQLSGNITLEGAVYGKGAGFNMGSNNGLVKAWTIVAGGNFDANQGRLEIDNTKYYSGGGGGGGGSGSSGGEISLDG
ncbi:pilus assembly protein TadG-related protein [Iamia majanohamensis]|uniref:Pilus assembly protein TadG-related protein n=1 Tax=Iamia majanohamensis TaxID=467976 RepID=A0AAE9YDT1_9ACTN|nr:pilus assembly protein TadG-related protein [Iamia majanohamensis]WCO65996.1 pilus assembly protein TadG-related protein [Iamia majanohamensis]